jgi:hypothetical protein
MINLKNIPVEPTVTILNPDGSELITTNDNTTFTYIRAEIKKNKLSGYKVRSEDGSVYDIHTNGKIYNADLHWPDGLTGDVFDNLLGELI